MDRTRFKDAPWIPQGEETVVIGGAGGLGSYACFFLARAGFKTILFDDDVVEEVNMAGQLFKKSHVGVAKVNAVADVIGDYAEQTVSGFQSRIEKDFSFKAPFMFSCFDNMEARKNLFETWKQGLDSYLVSPIFIDARLEAEQLQIFCVTRDKISEYEDNYLFSDAEVMAISCTMKQTSHIAAMAASHMVAFFTNHVTNIYERDNVRCYPFYYEYFSPVSLTTEIL